MIKCNFHVYRIITTYARKGDYILILQMNVLILVFQVHCKNDEWFCAAFKCYSKWQLTWSSYHAVFDNKQGIYKLAIFLPSIKPHSSKEEELFIEENESLLQLFLLVSWSFCFLRFMIWYLIVLLFLNMSQCHINI